MLNSVEIEFRPSALCASAERPALHNTLAQILEPEDVLLEFDATTADAAISAIARFVASRHGLSETAVRRGLAERERIGSTALGCGIAIPHARLKGLSRPVAVFVRPTMPVLFDAPDANPVTDMLVLLVPWEATQGHLLILAEVAAMFGDRDFRDELRSCADRDQVYARLTRRPGG